MHDLDPSLQRVFFPPASHPAVQRAAARLAGNPEFALDTDPARAQAVIGLGRDLGLDDLPQRTFRIFPRAGQLWIVGDRPRSVLAGALYWIHHRARGAAPLLPFERTSPFLNRLVLEDFPFSCYSPTGVKFDDSTYAENLVALGFTSMECNRFSSLEPIGEFWDGFQSTNPSPSRFVWTQWHDGVWNPDLVAANAAELRRCIDLACQFDLDPSVTMFLPRPYPERFFKKYPHLRGPSYEHEYLGRGGHPDVYCIDTDHPDGIAFYEAVFRAFVNANPLIRHYFFWHGDLGAQFWPDGQGPLKRPLHQRILEFHHLLDRIFQENNTDPHVWINPWAMPEHTFDELNNGLPKRIGYSAKDTPGAIHFNGTARFRMIDATVTTADIGDIAFRLKDLAARSGHKFCLGQYHDFSEDLDPILGAPHPLNTYRRITNMRAFNPDASATQWGVLSPDLSACRVNQDVMREMFWGAQTSCIEDLLPALIPAGLSNQARAKVSAAWRKVDYALQIWPQYWGMRFQGCGVRQRWLIKPLLPVFMKLPEAYFNRLVDRQLYRYNARNIFHEFMDLEDVQAREISAIYTDMIDLVRQAENLFEEAAEVTGQAADWVLNQLPPTRWMRIFWTSFRNQLAFHVDAPEDHLSGAQRHIILDEIENTRAALDHLRQHPRSLIIASRGAWQQCFGPDLAEDFSLKLNFMEGILKRPLNHQFPLIQRHEHQPL
jgi:hypothetical protein